MNYILEINAFEQWLETHYLPISAQLLWYKMMSICNRTGWSEWVTVDNLRLMAAMQMGREATLIKARDELIKAGLIDYQKGKKGSPNKYRMLSFTCKNVVQRVVQSEVESVVQPVVESVDIYKHKQNKTKKEKKNIKEIKHRQGEYNHVTLSDSEIEKLNQDFGEILTKQAVTYLDEYIEMKGYQHKSSYLAIRKWVIDAVREKGNADGNRNSVPARQNVRSGNEIVGKILEDRKTGGTIETKAVDCPFG